MIFHTVVLDFKHGTNAEEIEQALEHVRGLQQKIPGITSVIAGADLNVQNNLGYTHGFIMIFDTEEHFRAYAPHPEHLPVSQELQRICRRIIDFDLLEE